MLSGLNPDQITLRRWFLLTAAFIGISLSLIPFEWYYLLGLPVLLVLFYLLVFDQEKLLYLIAFSVPLSVPIKDIGGGMGLSLPTEPLIMLLFAGFVFKALTGSGFPSKIIMHSLSLVILGDLCWLFVTACTSTLPLVSFKYFLARTWFVMVCYLGLAVLFRKFRAIHIFIWLFSIATAILVLYTLANHYQGSFTRYYAYTAMRPFLPDHGMYAAAISFCIPPLFIYVVFGHIYQMNISLRIFAFALLAIIITGVILSFTRASWLSVTLAFVVFGLMLLGIRFRTLLMVGSLAAVGFFLVQQDVLNELSRNKNESADDIEEHLHSFSNVSTDPSNLERLNRWSCAVRMFEEKPILGWGPGTYTFQYAPFQISSELTIISTHSGDLGNVHSEYLRPLCESGLFGALGWLLIVLISISNGFYLFQKGSDLGVRYMAAAAVLGLITYFGHAVLNNYCEFDKIAVPMWGFMAILTALRVWHHKEPNPST